MTKINAPHETSEELIAKIQKNDDKGAMDELIKKNSALIYSIVKKYASVKKEYSEDLYQIGTIGLIKAAKNFDFSYGTQFSTYAVHLIRGELRKFFRDDGIIKVSRSLRGVYYKIKDARERYIAENGVEPTVNEIAEMISESYETIVQATEACRTPDYLYDYVDSSSDNPHVLQDIIKIEDKNLENAVDMIDLKNALTSLSKENRQLIVLRYFKSLTQAQVARMMNISQVQVSRLEKKIIENLQKSMRSTNT
jgi:RNA polymerase sporulation-specific sigma factor